MDVRWPKKSSTKLWEANGEKHVILQIRLRQWWWIGHTLKKGGESIAKQALDEIHREPDGGEEDQSKPEKGLFWRKQENVAKYERS